MQDFAAVAACLADRLRAEAPRLCAAFGPTRPGHVRWCAIDEVLPQALSERAFAELPALPHMLRLQDAKERKCVTADVDALKPTLQALVRAFNDPQLAPVVAQIMGKRALETDAQLYNGGVTVMLPGDFMRPHPDNSHDYNRARRREVVLLYYSRRIGMRRSAAIWRPGMTIAGPGPQRFPTGPTASSLWRRRTIPGIRCRR